MYDSFEGLPAGDSARGDPPAYDQRAGSMRCDVSAVRATFETLGLPPPAHIHKGWFEDTTAEDARVANPSVISFAHLDGDLYKSIKTSLEFVYPRMERGAIAVIDDYADPDVLNRHNIFPGAFAACSDFFADKPEDVVVLPTPHPGFAFPMQYECHAYFQKQ